MVFDLPIFPLEPTEQANPRSVSALNVNPSAASEGGSKETSQNELASQRFCHRESALGRAWRPS
jgi:hypothetical protein